MKLNYTDRNLQRTWVSDLIDGILGTVASDLDGNATRKKLTELGNTDPTYTESPYAKQQREIAQSLLNARMPSSADIEKNIAGNQANTQTTVENDQTVYNVRRWHDQINTTLARMGGSTDTGDAAKENGRNPEADYNGF